MPASEYGHLRGSYVAHAPMHQSRVSLAHCILQAQKERSVRVRPSTKSVLSNQDFIDSKSTQHQLKIDRLPYGPHGRMRGGAVAGEKRLASLQT